MMTSLNTNDDDIFKQLRGITGWVRPPGAHGCPPTEIIPGLWTAHYHDIDSEDKLSSCGDDKTSFKLVVNTAIRQCDAKEGSFGENVEVLLIDLEDDPDERKHFDAGKPSQSRCSDADVTDLLRCAGDAKKDFRSTSAAMHASITSGGAVMVHCHASISRSAAFILAYMIEYGGFSSLAAAVRHMKAKWSALWPCDRFTMQLIAFQNELKLAPSPPPSTIDDSIDQFKEVRQITGWVRPPGAHGCQPTEIIKGVWTAHYHDVDTQEKLLSIVGENMQCVVNTATCQCDSRQGRYGDSVDVVLVDLEDDPDERKHFDAGKPSTSRCTEQDVPEMLRCSGDAKQHFRRVSAKIHSVVAEGGSVLLHCHASISRSAVFILAYMLEYGGLTLPAAMQTMKSKWNATWPCDRFLMQLIEFQEELSCARLYGQLCN